MSPRDWAILAQQAYTTAPTFGTEDGAARVVLSSVAGSRVLAIPGTNNLACIEADVDALLFDAGPCGRVHAGIWHAFAAIGEAVVAIGADVIVGHSEGATGGLYLAAQLCLAGKPPGEVHAFEPARASIDGALATIFQAHGVQVSVYHHGRDVVPMVPLPIPGEDWQHPAPVIRFGKPSSIFPNIEDHMIAAVIQDL